MQYCCIYASLGQGSCSENPYWVLAGMSAKPNRNTLTRMHNKNAHTLTTSQMDSQNHTNATGQKKTMASETQVRQIMNIREQHQEWR